jgi:hypothetical protein
MTNPGAIWIPEHTQPAALSRELERKFSTRNDNLYIVFTNVKTLALASPTTATSTTRSPSQPPLPTPNTDLVTTHTARTPGQAGDSYTNDATTGLEVELELTDNRVCHVHGHV